MRDTHVAKLEAAFYQGSGLLTKHPGSYSGEERLTLTSLSTNIKDPPSRLLELFSDRKILIIYPSPTFQSNGEAKEDTLDSQTTNKRQRKEPLRDIASDEQRSDEWESFLLSKAGYNSTYLKNCPLKRNIWLLRTPGTNKCTVEFTGSSDLL